MRIHASGARKNRPRQDARHGVFPRRLRWEPSRETPLDIFVYEPFDFNSEYERALLKEGEIPARFASIPTLIAMKQAADRTQDRIDIEKLRIIAELDPNESERKPAAGD
jgi:hypothetical protein